jgi:hypothetical protein
MSNNKAKTAVGWLIDELIKNHGIQSKLYSEFEQAKEMEVMGKEMSYADGYAEGYKRALEMIDWYIKNYISKMPQDHIVDSNKMVEGGNNV